MSSAEAEAVVPRIATRDDAGRMIADLRASMNSLSAILADELAFVRAGNLAEAQALAGVKSDRAAVYTRLMLLAREEVSSLSRFLPAETEEFKREHEFFRAEVQISLAAIATARAVAEEPAAA
jgi:hypothetical protein